MSQIVLARTVTESVGGVTFALRVEAQMWKTEGKAEDVVAAVQHAKASNALWREAHKGEWVVLTFPDSEPDAIGRARVLVEKGART